MCGVNKAGIVLRNWLPNLVGAQVHIHKVKRVKIVQIIVYMETFFFLG